MHDFAVEQKPMGETTVNDSESISVEYIAESVAAIEAVKDDNEQAHVLEDSLYEEVLQAIAAGAGNPAELAAEALKVEEIHFERWYA